MIKIQKISSYDEFLKSEDIWKDLLSRCGDRNIFLTYEWVDAYIRHLAKNRVLLILYVFDEEKPVGIAPLIMTTYRYSQLPAKAVSFIGTGISDRMDFILEGDKDKIIALILDYLLGIRGWDVIDLREISEETGTMGAIERWLDSREIAAIFEPPQKTFFVEFKYDRQALLKKLTKKFNYLSNKKTDMNLEFERHNNGEAEIDALFSDMCLIEKNSWKGEAKRGIFFREDTRNFHRHICERFSKNKWLDISILKLDKKPIAYIYNYFDGRKTYFYSTSFDRRFLDISPGTMLMLWTLRDCALKDMREFDFLKGEEPWKRRYTEKYRLHNRVKIFRNSLYPRALYSLQSYSMARKNGNKDII